MRWYLDVLKKYAVFRGRARRKEYWMFFLFNIIISFILGLVDGLISVALGSDQNILANLYLLAVLLPGIAVSVRRLHDTGRSAWWVLIGLIPIIGPIILVVFLVQDSNPGQNEYGANPKEAMAA
ncbi:MAG: DUF805 domain-containing protein [Chloroflexota bacterium]|nr:DUF805 domain-containing protein [Chloroflexota bacterium]